MSTESESFLGIERDVLAIGTARMADALANSFLIIVLPLYISRGQVTGASLGLSDAALTGLVLAVFGVVSATLQPLTGRLSDRAGKRRLFVVLGVTVLAVSNLLYTWASSGWALLAIRAAQGVAVAITIPASVALVSEVSALDRRGRNMGVYNALRLIGFGVGPLAAGVVVEGGPYALPVIGVSVDGFHAVFLLAAAFPLLSAALVLAFVRDPAKVRPVTRRMALRIRARPEERGGGRFLDPIFTLGMGTLIAAACIALLATIEPQVNERLGQGPSLFAVEFAVFILSLAVTQPLVGMASDEWGRKIFVLGGLLLLVPSTLAQGFAVTPLQMILARIAQGVAGASVLAPAMALAGDLTEEGQAGAQLSVLTVSFMLGLSMGQMMSGFLVRFGYAVPFVFGAVLAVLGLFLVQTQVRVPPEVKVDGDEGARSRERARTGTDRGRGAGSRPGLEPQLREEEKRSP